MKISEKLRKDGVAGTIKKKLIKRREKLIRKYRLDVSNAMAKQLNYTVKYGIFSDLKLSKNAFWGQADLGSKTLGLYEQEIQTLLQTIQKTRKRETLIDIGGADGYFAVGALISNLFSQCVAFEVSEEGRTALAKTALNNHVKDRLTILKEANAESFQELIDSDLDLSDCVVLCDIEGMEFDLLNEGILHTLAKTEIIIEIHNWNTSVQEEVDKLHKRARKYFNIEVIKTRGRDLSQLEEVSLMSDLDRSMLVSEGRGIFGEWWYLTPITDS